MKTRFANIMFVSVAALAAAPVSSALADDKVHTERVVFQSGGERVVGTLYIPVGVSKSKPAPGLVVTGSGSSVKEQVSGRYAREMAQRGFVALAFDYRTWGESSGTQRFVDDPKMQVADILAATNYLDKRAETTKGKIAGLGVCGSAGAMAEAVVQSPTLKALTLVAPFLPDRKVMESFAGGADNVNNMMKEAKVAQERFATTGQQTITVAYALNTPEQRKMFAYYVDPTRGAIPQWNNAMNVASRDASFSFAFGIQSIAPRMTDPFLLVSSDKALIPDSARQFFANAKSTVKNQLWIDGVEQVNFYDQAEPVKKSADAAAAHFSQVLR